MAKLVLTPSSTSPGSNNLNSESFFCDCVLIPIGVQSYQSQECLAVAACLPRLLRFGIVSLNASSYQYQWFKVDPCVRVHYISMGNKQAKEKIISSLQI